MRKLPVFLTIATLTAATAAVVGFVSAAPSSQAAESGSRPSASPDDTAETEHDCGATGEHQEQVERDLGELGDYGDTTADGRQTATDCATITAFQQRMGIEPADGRADELTGSVAGRLAGADYDGCEAAGSGRTVCVDLTAQILWVVDDGERVFGPTVTRSGKPGYASTTGSFTINHKTESEWSEPFQVDLPYFQHYYAGEGLHEATSYLHDPDAGSHGCMNLLPADAKELYGLLDYGDTVEVFGNRPGT